MEQTQNATSPKTSNVTVNFHNVCSFCGKETYTSQKMDSWIASLITTTETKHACPDCSEKVKKAQFMEQQKIIVEERTRECGIPDNFREWDSSKGNKDLANAILNSHKKSLYISGHYGTCKTRAACANLLRRIKSGENGKYVRFGAIASKYQRSFSNGENAPESCIDSILDADILLIDDVGKRKITQTAGELLYEMLDRIYAGDTRCRVWITSNADLISFVHKFDNDDVGNAVVSRIDRLIGDGKMANIIAETP